jgi:DNA processing protein
MAPLPVATLDDRGRLACLRLIRSENVGPVAFRELINTYGGAQAALDALPELARRAGRARGIGLCPVDVAEAELEAAAKAGARPVFTIEPGYPPSLAAAEQPPPLLYVKGDLGHLVLPMIGIVGSRDCSAAGIKLTSIIANGLSAAGYVVASGLARGIDGAAHRTSMAGGTVAVVAGGIEQIYPPEHASLYAEIAERGCIITEQPPGYVARAKDFPRRNRIIAGISLGVVIVEAARRSGSLVTARYANEHGREVFAVPGHPLDPRAEGTNGLIKSGATLVTCADDVLSVLGPITGRSPVAVIDRAPQPWASTSRTSGPSAAINPSAAVPHDGDTARVVQALGPHPTDVDAIIRATELSNRAVQVALMELDLAGRIERHGAQLVSLKV